MSSFVSALDKYTPKQVGEKGHVEYGWSHDLIEKICQLHFQLVRTKSEEAHESLDAKLTSILTSLKAGLPGTTDTLALVSRMLGFTRDIVAGKGEQYLAIRQLWVWYQHFPEVALEMVPMFMDLGAEHPFGSWKDAKYICRYVKERSGSEDHPIVEKAIGCLIDRLRIDQAADLGSPVSLAGRWTPREKSKQFGWIFKIMAERMFPEIMVTAVSPAQVLRARRKCRCQLKRIIVGLNKRLDTPQVKMCAEDPERWAELNFNNVTSLTLAKNRKAIMNLTKKKEQRSHKEDRIKCASRFAAHIQAAKDGSAEHKTHGKRCNVYELVRDAVKLDPSASTSDRTEIDTIDLQWESNRSQNGALGKFIVLSDVSGSMETDDCIPLYNSVGIGIRISELTHPAFRDRIMTFSTNPTWIDLSGMTSFVQKVHKVKGDDNWGGSTDLYQCFQRILDVCVTKNIHPREVADMVLVILSDMQIDQADHSSLDTVFERITYLYARAGIESCYGAPYPTPHLLFWNLRKTDGFPVLSTQKNVTTMSGYNAVLLNALCDKGMTAFTDYTPFKMLQDLLGNERYQPLEDCLLRYI